MSDVRTSSLGAVRYSAESTFAESSTSTSIRLDTIGRVDVSGLNWPMLNANQAMQYAHDGSLPVRGVMGGSFTIEGYLTGLGGTAAGAAPASALATFLSYVCGNASAGPTGTTADGTGTATAFGTAASSGYTAGQLVRVGDLGDGLAEGQWTVCSSHSASTFTGLVALPGIPANTDVVYSSRTVYPSEDPANMTVASLRFALMTANGHYICRGCIPTKVEFTDLSPGQIPKWRVTFEVAYFSDLNGGTFPTTTAGDEFAPAPVAAGSFFLNTVGTATRATYGIRSLTLDIGDSAQMIHGPGGVDANQTGIDAARQPGDVMLTTVFDSEATSTETWWDLWNTGENSQVFKHALYSLSVVDGRALALYFPRIAIHGPAPTQAEVDGLNRVPVQWKCYRGATTTSDLTMSAYRIGMA